MPVRFDNEEDSPGLKRGGVLNVVQHELELVCDAAEIPDEIHIDLAGLDIGNSIHISQVTLPEGTKSAIDDRDFTVATIVAPSAMKAEEAEAAAAEAAAERRGAGSRTKPLAAKRSRGRRRRSLRLPMPRCSWLGSLFGASRSEVPGQPADAAVVVDWGERADADLGRPRQSRRAICAAPPQCRLHGGRHHRRGARLRSAPKKIPQPAREGRIGRHRILLLKPQTFMNDSGDAVSRRCASTSSTIDALTVFHDELDLAPFKVKVKVGGGTAGHNGLRSIDAHLGPDFRRVRIGIGHPGHKDQVTRHVLGNYAKAEIEPLSRPARARSPPRPNGSPTATTPAS